jgi:ABC-type nitrate/sulfonate/bicarbonate transport system substrate-binding protein
MIRKKKKLNKRLLIYVAIIFTILVLALFLIKTENTEPDLIIGYSTGTLNNAPITLAREMKLFEKQGLQIEYIPFSSTKYSRQAIASKQIDLVIGGANNYIEPMSQGVNIKFIAPVVTAPTYVFVRPNEITKLIELNNTKIATRIDSTSGYTLKRILKEENLDIEFEYVDIESEYVPIALMNKKIIDATSKGAEGKEEFLNTGAVILEEWEEKGYLERYFLHSSIIVDSSFLEENPEVVEKFINGYIEGCKFIVENPEESYEILAKSMNENEAKVIVYTNETIKESLSKLKFVLWIDPQEFSNFAEYAEENGLIDKNLSLEEIYDDRFEEKLKKAQLEIYGTED